MNKELSNTNYRTQCAKDKFFYFAFGSNLLTKRIQIQNPSAVRYGIGELKNYRLDFYGHAARWNGATATIVEHEGEIVWGVIWTIDLSHMDNLDRQEGVHLGQYLPIQVMVKTPGPENKLIECRAYQLVNNPTDRNHFSKPSETYVKVIVAGATESCLSSDYISRLESIETNGQLACHEMLESLGDSV